MKISFFKINTLLFLTLFLCYSQSGFSQFVTAVYTSGNGNTDSGFTGTETSSDCPLVIGVKIPPGSTITGVDVEYSMTAEGEALMSQQVSQLRCVSPGGENESNVYYGSGESNGTCNYKRTNLNIADNVSGGKTIFFELHAGRISGEGGCSSNLNYVNNNWKITVNFVSRSACSLTPYGGFASSSLSLGCSGVNTEIDLSAEGYSQGFTGLAYQWQRSANGSSGWQNITGATDPESASCTANTATFFRLAVTCNNTGETSYSNVLNYEVATCQTYNIGANSGTVNTCNAMFYDSGGTSDYSDGENKVVKFCSDEGNHVRVEFLSFNTEDNGDVGRYQERYDKLMVYDGPGTSDYPMFEFSGIQTAINKVPVVISSGECLSFRFVSDDSNVRPGWVAHVSCTDEESNIASQYCISAPNICNLNGYEGATSNFYNVERVYDQIEDTGLLFPGNSALDNNSFITFIASASTVVLDFNVYDCNGGFSDPMGIQFAVYSGSDCHLNSLVSSYNYIEPGLIEGSHTLTLSNLVAGQTYYMMTDGSYGAFCSYSIKAQSGIELAAVNPQQTAICEGESATITASGGSSFHWSGPGGFSSGQATINVTEQGVYTVTITGGISACPSEVILNSVVEVIPVSGTPVFNIPAFYCKGSSIPALPATSLNGITGTWTPAINNTQTTTYKFTSNNGICSEPYYHTITISPDITVQSLPSDCYGGNGTLIFSSSITQIPLVFEVDGVVSVSPLHLPSGTYTVLVTDANGCTASETQTISEPEKLDLSYELTNRSCFGKTDVDIKLSAEGGTEPYNFTLLSGELNFEGEEHFNLTESEYSIMVRDSKNCSDIKDVYIAEPAELAAVYVSHNPTCIGNIDGFIELIITGGTEPYVIYWDDNFADIPLASGLTEGVYDITIVDTNLCKIKITDINLTDMQFECLSIPNAFTPNADGVNDIWIIENLEIYSGAILYVYNRWGQLIYSGNCNEKWNGKYNDRYVPSGPYVYLLDLNDGTEIRKGIVTVVY